MGNTRRTLTYIPWTYRVHVDQPAGFLPRLLHPLEAEAGVHFIGELTALQPLEGRAIVPGSDADRNAVTTHSLNLVAYLLHEPYSKLNK